MKTGINRTLLFLSTFALLASLLPAGTMTHVLGVRAADDSQLFPETGKTVAGKFLVYWKGHGGLAQQGYPISGEMQEKSDTDGKTYTVQYFERAVFEAHPENTAPNDVLLSLLGSFLYGQKYPNGAPGRAASHEPGAQMFTQTGKHLGGIFLSYWNVHGGLAQQGYPISEEFSEKSDLDGKNYTVQYFERAVFEMHPENQPPFDVLLSQLGTFRFHDKYLMPATTATVAPTRSASPTATMSPAPTSVANEVRITLSFKHIDPMDLTIPAGKTRFIVTNVDTQFGQTSHDFSIYKDSAAVAAKQPLAATPAFLPSQGPQIFELDLSPGTYLTRCDVPGHAEVGMVGTLTVTQGP